MKSFVLSRLAQNDVNDIWDYTASQWGVKQAIIYTENIRDVCMNLADGSLVGRKTDIREGYSKYPVGAHFIYYRVANHQIDIIRILHKMMDVKLHF